MRRFDERMLHSWRTTSMCLGTIKPRRLRPSKRRTHSHHTPLSLEGSRLIDLDQSAGMTKQAMGDLVTQCEAWGLVQRAPDPSDARARRIVFTDTGLAWLRAFEQAVAQTEAEFRQEVGNDVATVIFLGLEAYAGAYTDTKFSLTSRAAAERH